MPTTTRGRQTQYTVQSRRAELSAAPRTRSRDEETDDGFITGKHIPRRTVLRGLGATVALPFLDAMVPARDALVEDGQRRRARSHAAGLHRDGARRRPAAASGARRQHLWSPAATGRAFDLSPSALSPLEPFRKYLTIVSDTDVRGAEAVTQPEIGGDHFRSSAVFLTQAHPKQTESSDVRAGISLDQIYAQRFGQDTPIPSMQLCIENVDQAGGCAYGYSCVYTDMISWASPTEPLPMIRDPRMAFDQLFGAGGSTKERAARRRATSSVLDYITGAGRRSQSSGSTRAIGSGWSAISKTCARSSGAFRRSKRAT